MTADADILAAAFAKADESLAAAKAVLAAGFPGAAASRAYYAAFHAACAALAARGLSFASHHATIGAFNREFVKTGLLPGSTTQLVRRLFQDRQTADYSLKTCIDLETATTDLADAHAFVALCRGIVSHSAS